MRDRYIEFERRGVEVVAIGLGSTEEARSFATRHHVPFPVLADPAKRSYAALSLGRARWREVIGPGVWGSGASALLRGRGIARPRQDPLQLGGCAVILRGGEIAYLHRAAHSADDLPVDELLASVG